MNNQIKRVEKIILRLYSAGSQLLHRLHNFNVQDSQLPKDIASWICDAIDQILPLMPEDYPDYTTLSDLRSQYKTSVNILLPSAEDELRKVLYNIGIASDCVRDAMRANPHNIPGQQLAEIAYVGLKSSLDEVVDTQFIQSLKGKENGITSKTAMLNIYGRICLWTHSIVKLNKPEDCLAIAGSVRSILELYVDLNLFNSNIIIDDADKFFSFPDIEKKRVANNISKSWKKLCSSPDDSTSTKEYLNLASNGKVETSLILKLWGRDKNGKLAKPRHWTNKSLWKRVELLDDNVITDIYFSSYYYCNWHVHSMYSDFINNLENVHLFNWHLYNLGKQMFLYSTRLINEIFEVLSKEQMSSILERSKNRDFKNFFGEMVKAARNQAAN